MSRRLPSVGIGERRSQALSQIFVGIPLTAIAFVAVVFATLAGVGLAIIDKGAMLVLDRHVVNPSSPIIRVWNWFHYTMSRTIFGTGDRYRLTP